MPRNPRPATLKLLEGRAPGRDSGGRKVEPTPAFVRYAPEKPDTLSVEAARHWDEIMPELERLELVNPTNIGGLVMMCETWSRHVEALRILGEEGILIDGPQGHVRHPAVQIAEKSSSEYRQWASQFGITPSSETRLGVKDKPQPGANPFAPKEGNGAG